MTGLPNLLINLGTQAILDLYFHWSGVWSILAYLIGLSFSIEYSVLYAIMTKTNFRFGKWGWSYGEEKKKN